MNKTDVILAFIKQMEQTPLTIRHMVTNCERCLVDEYG